MLLQMGTSAIHPERRGRGEAHRETPWDQKGFAVTNKESHGRSQEKAQLSSVPLLHHQLLVSPHLIYLTLPTPAATCWLLDKAQV